MAKEERVTSKHNFMRLLKKVIRNSCNYHHPRSSFHTTVAVCIFLPRTWGSTNSKQLKPSTKTRCFLYPWSITDFTPNWTKLKQKFAIVFRVLFYCVFHIDKSKAIFFYEKNPCKDILYNESITTFRIESSILKFSIINIQD